MGSDTVIGTAETTDILSRTQMEVFFNNILRDYYSNAYDNSEYNDAAESGY